MGDQNLIVFKEEIVSNRILGTKEVAELKIRMGIQIRNFIQI